MLRKSLLVVLLMALVLSVAATVAVADDTSPNPPSWAPQWFKDCTGPRTWAEWTFNCPIPGDGFKADRWGQMGLVPPLNPDTEYPVLSLTDNMVYNPLKGWITTTSGWTSADFHARMVNRANPEMYKQVWMQFDLWTNLNPDPGLVQLEWPQKNVANLPKVGAVGPGVGMGYSILCDNGWVDPDSLGMKKYVVEAYWEIYPQPSQEEFEWKWYVAQGGAGAACENYLVIDNVRMVTQCIPEPVFFQMGALLGLSGIGLLRARKR